MPNRYKRDLNRLIEHPRRRPASRRLRAPGGFNGTFSSGSGLPRQPLELTFDLDFATIPRSDDAPDGWGLPDDGNIGTPGGSSPWILIGTSDYAITRFVDNIQHGNLYWIPSSNSMPVLSWVGPENGYLKDAASFSSFGSGAPTQQAFGRELFSGGKKIGECEVDYQIVGAALRKESSGYTLMIVTQYLGDDLRLETAAISNLAFSDPVTSWTPVTPPTNPDVTGGYYRTDGVVRFNESANACAFIWGGTAYEWDLVTNQITKRDDLAVGDPDNDPGKPPITVTDTYSDYVSEPPQCGGPDPWPTTLQQVDALDQDWSRLINHFRYPACLDYSGDTLVVGYQEGGTQEAEVFSYIADHTHTRNPDDAVYNYGFCSAPWSDGMENLVFSGYREGTVGIRFTVDGTDVTKNTLDRQDFSGGPGEMVQPAASTTEPENRMRIRVAAESSVDSFRRVEREHYVRYLNMRADVAIFTQSETESTTTDTDGMRLWTQRRKQILRVQGVETVFSEYVEGTFREEDILDINGNIIVLDPRVGTIKFHVATNRAMDKVFASIFDGANNTQLNYLTGSDPVVLTGVTGTNPRFDPIALI